MNKGIPQKILKSGWAKVGKEVKKALKEQKIGLGDCFSTDSGRLKRRGLKKIYHAVIKKYPNIKLYLHGHTHKPSITKEDNLPYMICSGCSSHKKNASFSILKIEDDKCNIYCYILQDNNWQKDKVEELNFS